MSVEFSLSELFKHLLAALKDDAAMQVSSGSGVAPTDPAAQGLVQQALMMSFFGFVNGDWALLDRTLPRVGGVIIGQAVAAVSGGGGGPSGNDPAAMAGAFEAAARAAAESAYEVLLKDEELQFALVSGCIEGSDPLGHTRNAVFQATSLILNTYYSFVQVGTAGEGPGGFSACLKAGLTQVIGQWLEEIARSLAAGRAGLQGFAQGLGGIASRHVVAYATAASESQQPQQQQGGGGLAQMAPMAIMMLTNMALQMHAQVAGPAATA